MQVRSINIETESADLDRERVGLWGWVGLYATGLLMFFFVLFHMALIHFQSSPPLSLARTTTAYQSSFVVVVEFCLLLLAVIHCLFGLRRVLLDLEIFSKRGRSLLTLGLLAGGLGLVVWGLFIFYRFTLLG